VEEVIKTEKSCCVIVPGLNGPAQEPAEKRIITAFAPVAHPSVELSMNIEFNVVVTGDANADQAPPV
jgi:hypothetical protein